MNKKFILRNTLTGRYYSNGAWNACTVAGAELLSEHDVFLVGLVWEKSHTEVIDWDRLHRVHKSQDGKTTYWVFQGHSIRAERVRWKASWGRWASYTCYFLDGSGVRASHVRDVVKRIQADDALREALTA